MSRFTAPMTRLSCAVALASGLAAAPAHATKFSASELTYDNALLSNFNLVTLGNLNVSNANGYVYTDGRTLVGGNLVANTGYGACVSPTGATCVGNATVAVDATKQQYGALTVFGNFTTTSGNPQSTFVAVGYNGLNAGATATAYVRGAASGIFEGNGKANLNVNGSTSGLIVDNGKTITTTNTFAGTKSGTGTYVTAGASTVFPFNSNNVATITAQAKALSSGIAALPGSPGVKAEALPTNNNIFFTANNDYIANGYKYGVVTTTLANLASSTAGIGNGTNDATLVIVTGDVMTVGAQGYNANYVLPSLSGYTGTNGSKIIYDFVDATTLKFAGNWTGSILAPLATITSMGGSIDGSVIVASINQTQNLVSTNLFAGDLRGLVPEPASLLLLGGGVAAVAAFRRRRK